MGYGLKELLKGRPDIVALGLCGRCGKVIHMRPHTGWLYPHGKRESSCRGLYPAAMVPASRKTLEQSPRAYLAALKYQLEKVVEWEQAKN